MVVIKNVFRTDILTLKEVRSLTDPQAKNLLSVFK